MTYVVAGVSGHTGRVVAESLLARKQPVRVVVRSADRGAAWRERGAEVAVADLGDAPALARALAGAVGAYLLVPTSDTAPGFRAQQDRITDSIVAAVKESRVPHVVLLSSIGAQHEAGTGPIAGLHRAEQELAKAGAALTFLRAGFFMENLRAELATLEQGFIPSFFPADLGIDMIATADIGRLAASLLVEGPASPRGRQVVELAGPRRSMADVAAALASITGKAVRVAEAPLDAMVGVLTGFGMPEDLAAAYHEMTVAITSRRVEPEGGHRRVVGTTSLEEVLRGLLGQRASAAAQPAAASA
jgi:uncharacterized protein YbjT (DUF2867 family)